MRTEASPFYYLNTARHCWPWWRQVLTRILGKRIETTDSGRRFLWAMWRGRIMLLRIIAILLLLAAAPAFADSCPKEPVPSTCPPHWNDPSCLLLSRPHHLVYRQASQGGIDRLLVRVCYTHDPDLCDDAPPCADCCYGDPVTLAQWCQELAGLPIPSGTPAGVPRPEVKACSGAVKGGAVSGDPTP